MTVSAPSYAPVSFAWTGAETVFATGLKVADADDLAVSHVAAVGGAITPLTLNAHYRAELDANRIATLYPLAIPAGAGTINVVRVTELTQATNFVDGVSHTREAYTRAFDKLTLIAQEMRRDLDGGLAGLADLGPLEDYEAAAATAEDAAAAALAAVPNTYVASLAALKALPSATKQQAYLIEPGKEGQFLFRAGNYAAVDDGYAYVKADDTANTAGAWVKQFHRPPRPQDFGGTDKAATQRAINYAQRETGVIEFVGNFTLNDSLDVSASLDMIGRVDKHVLDFTTRPDFAKGSTDGLIRALGTRGADVALTQSMRRPVTVTPSLVAAARTGTEILYEWNMPHNVVVGDPVWVYGVPASSAQAVFYTVRYGMISPGDEYCTRTTPYLVTAVVDGTKFKVACADTGDTVFSGAANMQYAADVLRVGSTAGFVEGDIIKILSDATRAPELSRIAEFGVIARLIATPFTGILLHAPVRDVYATGDSARISKTSLISPVFDGLSLYGKGPNLDTAAANNYGDRGIYAYLTDRAVAKRCKIRNIDQMGILFRDAVNMQIEQNNCVSPASDEAGFATSGLDIQYGVAIDGAIDGGSIDNNWFYGWRHSINQAGTSTTPYGGVAHDVSVTNNKCFGAWLAAISTHQCAGTWNMSGNFIWGSESGINMRYTEDTVINDNTIHAYTSAVQLYRVLKAVKASGNILRGAEYGLRVDTLNSVAEGEGPLTFCDNDVEAAKPVYVYLPTSGMGTEIEIDNNRLAQCDDYGVRIWVGDSAAGGMKGQVSRNRVIGRAGATGRKAAYWITNGKDIEFAANEADANGTAFERIAYFDGAQTSGIQERDTRAIGLAPTVALVGLAAGTAARLQSVEDAPATKTGDFTCDHGNSYVNNKSGSPCVVTLPPPSATWKGREIQILSHQAQATNSASANVIPLAGGAAGTAILAPTGGKWARLRNTGAAWQIVSGN